ncbi:MAG: hypothetical protein MUE33_06395 [Cytophagaceae bacterium]|jgi:hypothetical protein|nr:hypothetical protein [Cytophagaceae bacterium]
MLRKGLVYSIFFILFLLSASCKRAPGYPDQPSIQFDNLRVTVGTDVNTLARVDSVFITIRFQDGNGDLGNDPPQANDYFLKVFKKSGGVFSEVLFTGLDYNGKLPLLSPLTASGPIDGTITRSVTFIRPGIPPGPLFPLDTLRFDVQIKDRAGNFSQWVTTDSFVLWR